LWRRKLILVSAQKASPSHSRQLCPFHFSHSLPLSRKKVKKTKNSPRTQNSPIFGTALSLSSRSPAHSLFPLDFPHAPHVVAAPEQSGRAARHSHSLHHPHSRARPTHPTTTSRARPTPMPCLSSSPCCAAIGGRCSSWRIGGAITAKADRSFGFRQPQPCAARPSSARRPVGWRAGRRFGR
jgi:hypothetical protein